MRAIDPQPALASPEVLVEAVRAAATREPASRVNC